jgi:hypothetical protein
MRPKSPYLKDPRRLPDVIAAVQLIAAAQRPERKISDWTKELSGDEKEEEIERWTAVFNEHPEFFLVYRVKGEPDLKAALRVRYTNKLYDAIAHKEYTQEEKDKLEKTARDRLTTKPLSGEMITAMTNTAIALHASAVAELSARRWWVAVLTAALGFVGAVLGSYIGAHK